VASATRAVLNWQDTGYETVSNQNLFLQPYGSDANNETLKARIIGWSYLRASGLWVPHLLAQFTVTLGNLAAGLGTNTFLADTIDLEYGDASLIRISPANDIPGSVVLDVRGAQLVEIDFDRNSSAASANALYRRL
jgi:hypothetical protein